ncbi:MAG TPA: class I SAM-dependent methyltransferase [Rhodanobacteraceae bacterium]|nr:class I SAM-dependent methyltransferase [Rhodanobacteraceae bacterium]
MRAERIRRLARAFRRWPIHPQWLLTTSGEDRDLDAALASLRGDVLDIGCAGRRLAARLPAGCTYVGLDYPDTASAMYRTRPDVFGDAGRLPFADRSFDAVLLKDVLEHLGEPDAALAEIARVLRPGGRMILWIPFIYPIHDAPYDFQRLTEHGVRRRVAANAFDIETLKPVLAPIETAALMFALASADAAERIVADRRIALPLVPVLAVFILFANLAGKALGWLPATRFMPASYRVMAIRRDARDSGR